MQKTEPSPDEFYIRTILLDITTNIDIFDNFGTGYGVW